MAKKMGKGLIALSSAAIVSVYGIGYALTEPAAVSMAAGQANGGAPVSAPTGQDTAPLSSAPSAQLPASGSSSRTAASNSTALKDGSYSGTGWSRHGSVSVRVTVQNGRIIAAPITGVTTRYSQNVISGLPSQVVRAQSSQVDLVSGATDSSVAYMQAVAEALSQAGGAATPSNSSSATNGAGSQPGFGAAGGSVQVTGPNGVIYGNGSHRRGSRERDYFDD